MATCFCGHGEKVGLSLRGPNKQGRRTVELLGQLRALKEAAGHFDSLQVLDGLIGEGEDYESEWSNIVHGGPVPPPAEARAFKKEWEAWGKRGMYLISTLQKHAKGASGRKGFVRLGMVVQELEARLDTLSPGAAREAGEGIYGQLEPISRGQIPEGAQPGSATDLILQADFWLAATSDG